MKVTWEKFARIVKNFGLSKKFWKICGKKFLCYCREILEELKEMFARIQDEFLKKVEGFGNIYTGKIL